MLQADAQRAAWVSRSHSNVGKEADMRIGTALVLIALGAILRFAVSVDTDGFNINTIGLILIIVGIVGLVISLLMYASADRRVDRTVIRDRDVY
jgi:uncharacterized membrane protein YidH (DUF202 family)